MKELKRISQEKRKLQQLDDNASLFSCFEDKHKKQLSDVRAQCTTRENKV
jgi:hypothetical protein